MTQNYIVPNQMIAIEVINPGNQSQLQQTTVAVPALKAGQVLLKVSAAGVNRADLLQRSGLYPEVHLSRRVPAVGAGHRGGDRAAHLASGSRAPVHG